MSSGYPPPTDNVAGSQYWPLFVIPILKLLMYFVILKASLMMTIGFLGGALAVYLDSYVLLYPTLGGVLGVGIGVASVTAPAVLAKYFPR